MIEVSKEAGERKNGHWLYWTWENGFEHGIKCSEQGWYIIGFDVTRKQERLLEQGLSVVDSLSELLKALNKRKVIF